MEMIWDYEFSRLTMEERARYKPEQIAVGFCRVYGEYITLDKVFVLAVCDIKEPKINYNAGE